MIKLLYCFVSSPDNNGDTSSRYHPQDSPSFAVPAVSIKLSATCSCATSSSVNLSRMAPGTTTSVSMNVLLLRRTNGVGALLHHGTTAFCRRPVLAGSPWSSVQSVCTVVTCFLLQKLVRHHFVVELRLWRRHCLLNCLGHGVLSSCHVCRSSCCFQPRNESCFAGPWLSVLKVSPSCVQHACALSAAPNLPCSALISTAFSYRYNVVVRTTTLEHVLLNFIDGEPDLTLSLPQSRRQGPADAVDLLFLQPLVLTPHKGARHRLNLRRTIICFHSADKLNCRAGSGA